MNGHARSDDDYAELFGPDGVLAGRLSGYLPRPQQQAMAEAVADVIAHRGVLVCEAGTGTGKTFAYLVPALLSKRKVLVSTGTRNLQDQLFHRDLPLIRNALGLPVRAALLKGRANYLCSYRLTTVLDDWRRLDSRARGLLSRVRDWASVTVSGDIAELSLPDDSPLWPAITSTGDNCLGQKCPDWQACHLVEARRAAQAADLVVVNHHLLCADLALKDEGFGEVLPGADCMIIDEAHQLPDVAGAFFGMSVSGRQLHDLTRDVEIEYHREAGDVPEIPERLQRLRRGVQDLRLTLGDRDRRGAWQELESSAGVIDAMEAVRTYLDRLYVGLDALKGRGKGLDSCLVRAEEMRNRLGLLLGGERDEGVRWFEVQGRGFRLHETPLDVSAIFAEALQRHKGAWVFTSATLAVKDSFEHFTRQLGIEDARTERWDSPFDYQRQALWFVPRGLPQPSYSDYNRAVSELSERIVRFSRGRAFLLFTSHRALREAADYLRNRLQYPILVQGEAPRAELIDRFRTLGNAVLLGTASFWEGVDVRGDALSCVIIDKLPFASPGDPVLAARIEALKQRGGNPFREYQLPQAILALKQGAGRLIRGVTDRGVLVVCDPRLLKRSYGHAFLASLPPMAHSRELEEVEAFFSEQGEALEVE